MLTVQGGQNTENIRNPYLATHFKNMSTYIVLETLLHTGNAKLKNNGVFFKVFVAAS